MITSTLTLRFGARAVYEPRAWYVPGADPATWLGEITAWNVPHESLRLLPIPRSRSSRGPAGVLVVAPRDSKPRVSRQCVAFGCPVDRLFVPIEAGFFPAVADEELQALLASQYTYVWHPASGLTAVEPDEFLSVADLLSMPDAAPARWDRAEPGVGFSRRIASLVPRQPPTIEMILEEGQDDIGTEAETLDQLPPSPAEPKGGLAGGAGRQGLRLLANMARWLADNMLKKTAAAPAATRSAGAPSEASGPTWIDQLGQWANRQLANLSAGLEAARNKEISRLLHMLETDPDRGLRFALPMSGGAHRGLAPPSRRLAERDVNFRLGGHGGGRPADLWNISPDYHLRLLTRYRELANREIQLGRHRRAAYIFAELLGDHDAAANTLASGHHWREAAVLYRERLKRPLDAARCLERGGLWTEAIELYRELGEHEKAGDLLRQLDQPDEALAEFRKAVTGHCANGDYLSAARLLEEKMELPGEAIGVLDLGWVRSAQAGQCLRETFRLLGRLGQHESAARRVDDLGRHLDATGQMVTIAEVLSELSHGYPDREVNRRAADNTRVIAARQVPVVSGFHRRQLLAAVARLCPEDRLLRRDCDRYLQPTRVVAKPTPRRTRPTVTTKAPTLVRSLQLPGDIRWRTAIASGRSIFAAGTGEKSLCVARASWENVDSPCCFWPIAPQLYKPTIILAAEPRIARHVLVHMVGFLPLSMTRHFHATDSCPSPVSVGSVKGVTRHLIAADRAVGGMNWLLQYDETTPMGLCLVCTGPNGEHVSTRALSFEEQPASSMVHTPDAVRVFSLCAHGNRVYVAAGRQMRVYPGDTALPEVVPLPRIVRGLTASAPNTRLRVATTFDIGGAVCWDDFTRGNVEVFAGDMPEPIAAFNRGGHLVAACEGKCEVYATRDRRLCLKAEMRLARRRPIAVLGGPRTDYFGVVFADGTIEVYEIP